ncbi:MAG: hypothetical protein R3F37_13295 [Candidatus Competibacteraceae bacterium]
MHANATQRILVLLTGGHSSRKSFYHEEYKMFGGKQKMLYALLFVGLVGAGIARPVTPKPLQSAIIRGRRHSWDEAAAAWLLSEEEGEATLDETRFHSAARGSINTDIELELLLTALRRTLLLQGGQQ